MKIVTHDSSFHADDVFAVATLLLVHPEAEVVRSRNPEVLADADYVLDTGMVYDPSKNRFDHHMREGAGRRENGIPYASFGLVWKEFGERVSGGKREAEIIDGILVQPLDALDNGVAVSQELFKGVREFSINDFLYSFLSSSDKSDKYLYDVFMHCVGIAKDLIVREVERAKERVIGEKLVMEAYEKSSDKRLVELPVGGLPWKGFLANLPEPVFAIHPRPDGHWTLGAVPDISKPYGHNRKDLPEAWAGKEGAELEKVTGVPGSVFAHNHRFMAAAETKEAALELADKALKA